MKLDLAFFKRFWWVPIIVGYLGLGQYFEGLQLVFRFQMEAHASEVYKKIGQNKDDINTVACIQIVAGYIRAKQENNIQMISHWTTQAAKFGCTLPDI